MTNEESIDLTLPITIPSNDDPISEQTAADILNVSLSFLVSLLDAGTIPFITVGAHRLIRLADLMEYKKHRDEEAERGLENIVRIGEELGLYDL